jgi:hypothetical protein
MGAAAAAMAAQAKTRVKAFIGTKYTQQDKKQ